MEGTIYGSVLAPKSLPGHLAEIVSAIEMRFKSAITVHRDTHGIKAEIDIVVVDNDDLDATAEPEGAGYRIHLFKGLLCAVYDTFFALLADPDVIPQVGRRMSPDGANVTAVRDYYTAFLGAGYKGVADELRGRADAPGRFPFILPGDGTRKSYALGLGNLAIEYVLGHEFAHILGGHCDYLLSAGLTSTCHEINRLESDAQRARLSRTLEWHADTFAARSVAMFVPNRRAILQNIDRVFATREEHYMAWAFAIVVLFRLLGGGTTESVLHASPLNTHPHPILRAMKLRLATSERLRRESEQECRDWETAFEEAARQAAVISKYVGVEIFPISEHSDEIAPAFDALEDDMVKFVPQLKFLSRRAD